MNRPAVLAWLLIALVLLPAVVVTILHPGDTGVYELGSGEHVPAYGPGVAPHDNVPSVDPADATTTTARKARHRSDTFRAAVYSEIGERRGIPCGGDMPPCPVIERESMMAEDPVRVWNDQVNADGGPLGCYYPVGYDGDNPCGSTASGPWQVLRSTWNWFGGFLNAADAPLHVQIDKVRQLWAGGAGCFHWNACR